MLFHKENYAFMLCTDLGASTHPEVSVLQASLTEFSLGGLASSDPLACLSLLTSGRFVY